MGYKADSFIKEIEKIALMRESAKILKLYHGTSDINAKKIKLQGLKNETGSAKWYMLSSHIDDAIFHSERDKGNPVVIEFEIPYGNKKWEGYPYLWKPYKSGFKGTWYAVRETLPPEFIQRIIKVKPEDLKRVRS